MKPSLLDYLGCPVCESRLVVLAVSSPPGAEASPKAGGKKGQEDDKRTDIEEGLLACRTCGRWFPVRGSLPEILPDTLRSPENDLLFLKSISSRLEPGVYRSLVETSETVLSRSAEADDGGASYKKAEMTIKTKIEDEAFFGPGYFSPFNPGNPDFTGQLIRRFGNVVPLLELKPGEKVADIGVGYAWTSEWMARMGATVVGVDICRTYLEIGLQRMREAAPHLVVADVENLPLKAGCFDAVLCYDAFHHVHDRKKAMLHFWRILKPGGRVALAEPGPEHEEAEAAREVMEKYGILEKGMSLEDLKGYCHGAGFSDPEEHFILDVRSGEKKKFLTRKFLRSHAYADCRFYRMRKPSPR